MVAVLINSAFYEDCWLSWNLNIENIEFLEYRTEVPVLNATAIASGYAGRDSQGGTSDVSFF